MSDLSVSQAARVLGVTVPRVHQRIRDGSLDARRVGHQWVVSAEALRRVREPVTGRRFSPRSAWTIVATSIAVIEDDPAPAQAWAQTFLAARASKERTRALSRLRLLLTGVWRDGSDAEAAKTGARLRHAFGGRARREALWAAATDIQDLRADARVVPGGLCSPISRIAAGQVAEMYVDAERLDQLVEDYLLERRPEPNVFLHAVDNVTAMSPPRDVFAAPLLLAADLAEHARPREEHRAAEILAGLARDLR